MSQQLTIPNLPQITRDNPKLGEALAATQTFVNNGGVGAAGNKKSAPPTTVATPTVRPG